MSEAVCGSGNVAEAWRSVPGVGGLGKTGAMSGRPKAWMSWSSGKDSAMALHKTRSEGAVEVTALLTTVNSDAGRVAVHAVRRSLLAAQADRLSLRLFCLEVPSPCPNEAYEARMADASQRRGTRAWPTSLQPPTGSTRPPLFSYSCPTPDISRATFWKAGSRLWSSSL